VILFWKHMAMKQQGKMKAYELAAERTGQSVRTVCQQVADEDAEGVAGLSRGIACSSRRPQNLTDSRLIGCLGDRARDAAELILRPRGAIGGSGWPGTSVSRVGPAV